MFYGPVLPIFNVTQVILDFGYAEIPLWGHNLRFFRFSTLPDWGHQRNTERALPARETHILNHYLFLCDSRVVREPKNTEKGTQNVIFRVLCGGVPVQSIAMIFGTARDLGDEINRTKLCIDRFKSFGLREGQIWGLP